MLCSSALSGESFPQNSSEGKPSVVTFAIEVENRLVYFTSFVVISYRSFARFSREEERSFNYFHTAILADAFRKLVDGLIS